MITASVQVHGLDGIRKLVKNVDEFNANLKSITRRTGFRCENDAKRFAPVDTGQLRSSIRTEKMELGYTVQVGPPASLKNISMETGRKPGRMPPVAALIPWVRRHGNVQYSSIRTKRVGMRNVYGNDEARIRSIAFLIARKIGRRGVKARAYMGRAFLKNRDKFIKEVQKEIRRALQ